MYRFFITMNKKSQSPALIGGILGCAKQFLSSRDDSKFYYQFI